MIDIVNENWPGRQDVHGVLALTSKSAVPAAQPMQDAIPALLYWPAPQAAHAVAGLLSVSANPVAHAKHESAPTLEY
eukprot:SAG25_NODE_5779_length_621_cov_1.482759_2_plen_76_part_01